MPIRYAFFIQVFRSRLVPSGPVGLNTFVRDPDARTFITPTRRGRGSVCPGPGDTGAGQWDGFARPQRGRHVLRTRAMDNADD
uniref:Uncharacterized protein n=1 Tax=Oryza punctata TaxID=4537 RepID=A0A0E0L889_ORYPU